MRISSPVWCHSAQVRAPHNAVRRDRDPGCVCLGVISCRCILFCTRGRASAAKADVYCPGPVADRDALPRAAAVQPWWPGPPASPAHLRDAVARGRHPPARLRRGSSRCRRVVSVRRFSSGSGSSTGSRGSGACGWSGMQQSHRRLRSWRSYSPTVQAEGRKLSLSCIRRMLRLSDAPAVSCVSIATHT